MNAGRRRASAAVGEREIPEDQLLAGIPPLHRASGAREMRGLDSRREVLVVIDDDPTGSQSVVNTPLILRWQNSDIEWALTRGTPSVFILTNSRSLDAKTAAAINRLIVQRVVDVAGRLSLDVSFLSRSDSTLRGHFPEETDAITDVLRTTSEGAPTGLIFVPAFPDAGRVTVHGVHYVRHDGVYQPAGMSEFARDIAFGYRSSYLPNWLEEKDPQIHAEAVVTLDLSAIRADIESVGLALGALGPGDVAVADAFSNEDLDVLAKAIHQAEEHGKRFLFRSGPSLVGALTGARCGDGVAPRGEAISRVQLAGTGGGLLVVGSHVELTNRQLAYLRNTAWAPQMVTVDVRRVDDDEYLLQLVDDVVAKLRTVDVGLITSREVEVGADENENLSISRRVSLAMSLIVQKVVSRSRPVYLIAKGGITSHDTAMVGLEMNRATVVGPIRGGTISMWESVDGLGRGMPYVVFPGNVGTVEALADVVHQLTVGRV